MGFFKDAKQAMANARNMTLEERLATLTPEQRAKYDANMAHVEAAQAESQASWEQAQQMRAEELGAKVLKGPAGEFVHGKVQRGPSPDEVNAQVAGLGAGAVLRQALRDSKSQFTAEVKDTVARNVHPEVTDPAQRQQVAAHERGQRDALRAAYRASHAQPVAIARITARGGTQLQTLIQRLGESGFAARPDLVYGIYRVPDRISPTLTPTSEKGRIVEWDVVHVPGALAPVAPQLMAAQFGAGLQWVARRRGEPEVIDEDLPLAYCTWAGIGPEHTLGVARFPSFRAFKTGWQFDSENQESPPIMTLMEGAMVLHTAHPDAGGIADRMMAGAPMQLPPESLPMAYVERLDWTAVRGVVHPQLQRAPLVPSPFPYLPSTPQEVLCAYLEVVGIQASDCYSAQVTIDEPRRVQGTFSWMEGSTNIGSKMPCADGKDRQRIQAAQLVVVAYRDRPEYVAGRERWKRYQSEILFADLDIDSHRRPPVQVEDGSDISNPILRTGMRILEAASRVSDVLDGIGGENGRLPPHRYCWPPVG